MSKTWKVLPKKYPDLIDQLLFNRGITNISQKQLFFEPTFDDFTKDLQISGISQSLKRINKAVDNQELIVIYGDYDVDGICASTILYKSLTSKGAKVLPYIPHREKEGYGLSKLGLEFARDSGASVVITVDNGIVAVDQAQFAKQLGLDLIITDHHLPLETLPDAYSIVHSTKMCGAAVAWCLIKDLITESLSKELLQFVAIATVCDMMELKDLGRLFVKEGLVSLNKSQNLGLTSLINECNLGIENITSYEVGHILGPRLNAIGRLEHAIDALRLLCTKDPLKAKKLAKLLCDTNSKRQDLTIQAVDEARLQILDENKNILVVSSSTWIPGVIGLIAGRIAEEYSRPTIAISVGETNAKGSARSIDGINIVETIRNCSDLLIDVGGHKGAAGFSLLSENIDKFKNRIEGLINNLPKQDRILEIEAEISEKDLTKKLVKEIDKFEPFGFGNSKPILAIKNAKISDVRTLKEGKHLKFKADNIDAIAFGMGEYANVIKSGQLVDLAFYLEINKFNGQENLQLKIKDIKLN